MVPQADMEEAPSTETDGQGGKGKGKRQGAFEGSEGRERKYLRAFETVPVQLLNAYGESRFNRMPDKAVWSDLKQPLKSGAPWMTEYCDPDVERQGVAVNRFLQPLVAWCKYQKLDSVRKQNAFIMNEARFQQLYDEIDAVLPSLQYCLAPKKEREKRGAQRLRAGADAELVGGPPPSYSEELLRKHAAIVYDHLLDQEKGSKIRLLVSWQSAGGLSFVAHAHFRATMCFRYLGRDGEAVSLSRFQEAVMARHTAGTDGMEEDTASQSSQLAADLVA